MVASFEEVQQTYLVEKRGLGGQILPFVGVAAVVVAGLAKFATAEGQFTLIFNTYSATVWYTLSMLLPFFCVEVR